MMNLGGTLVSVVRPSKAQDRGHVFEPDPVILPPSHYRVPTRAVHLRPANFDEEYDFCTLFYDTFLDGADAVELLGPPLLNLRPIIAKMSVQALPSRALCRFRIRQMDRHTQIRIPVPAGTQRLKLTAQCGEWELTIKRNLSDIFANERVLLTLSKDNRLSWIQDWVRYNRDVHGATAVLFYDNASRSYSLEDLVAALREVGGIRQVCVVRWPFRYGPQGGASRSSWDSDYSQHGVWEHARRMFLKNARSVLNSDIDELVVSNDLESVFDAAEQSPIGFIRYHGVWVPGLSGLTAEASPEREIRYRDFSHHLIPSIGVGRLLMPRVKNRCPCKWAIVPRSCPDYVQWAPHSIKRWPAAFFASSKFSYRHFREINTNWKYQRGARESHDVRRHRYDEAMIRSFRRVRWSW
jgi:hypothetical protein